MKKRFIFILGFLLVTTPSFALGSHCPVKEQFIQNRIDDIGNTILNANKIQKRIIFVYNNADKKSKLKLDRTLLNRQIVLYDGAYKYIENDDEMAAFMSREIVIAARSFDGRLKGGLNSLQIQASPKKYEMIADKLAVDMMVNAGYDPIGLITYIHKTVPQRRFDAISSKNLASKRLAVIYEYIFTKYPYFLVNNKYLENVHYQNFLLTSQNNRRLLKEKLQSGSKEKIKYE